LPFSLGRVRRHMRGGHTILLVNDDAQRSRLCRERSLRRRSSAPTRRCKSYSSSKRIAPMLRLLG
jgi:hypothetical protein